MKIRNLTRLSTKARSKKSEKRAADFLGGKVQIASGALQVSALKADVISHTFLCDDKITGRSSYGLSVKLWRKLANEARQLSRHPLIRICFTDGPTLYVMDEPALHELLTTDATNKTAKPLPRALPLRKSGKKRR